MNDKGKKQLSLMEREEKILEFWEKNKIFEKSVRQRKGGKKFIFYEGPPYANGMPGIHHIEVRAFKDIILRYKTMKGFYAPRRAGWDTHGLPTEMEVEKKLGVKSKKEIEEKIGIENFIEEARKNVFLYKEEWEKLTKRIGYWLDLENPYVTMTNDYIENLWLIIKKIGDRGLLYEDYKVLPWCPRCQTALSSHELAQGYKKIKDTSIFVKFSIFSSRTKIIGAGQDSQFSKIISKFQVPSSKFYFLVWTTTPWTLSGNVALAINPKLKYALIKTGEEYLILAKSRLAVIAENYEIIEEFNGKDLIGWEYEPLYFFDDPTVKSFKVLGADFVSADEGTGIVHIAPAFGDDDMKVSKKNNLPVLPTVNEEGKIKENFPGAGKFIKEADPIIIDDLKSRGLLFKTEEYEHDYPFCWRCQSPLMYYARNSWWFKTSAVKEKMLKENAKINWHPAHLRDGRFGEWLKEVRDWAISRERYWGTALPVWQCQTGKSQIPNPKFQKYNDKLKNNSCGNYAVIGSLEELKKRRPENGLNLYIIRHGQAKHNTENISNGDINRNHFPLTEKGVEQVKNTALKIKKSGVKIDLIIASDFLRTKQTAEILRNELDVGKIFYDKRLREINVGIFEGKNSSEYHKFYSSVLEKFYKAPSAGESLRDIKKRSAEFLKEIYGTYKNKNILIVSHEYPLWILSGTAQGLTDEEIANWKLKIKNKDFINLAEFRKLKYLNLPLSREGDLDLHRPYIDEIKLKCEKCGEEMKRVSEVIDVWFDSGAMPFAQNQRFWAKIRNSKFEIRNSGIPYPADYICEAIDQTRGWFYTLLAVSSLLGLKAPYKNVLSCGLVLDEKGQKMSKSKGNVVNPWELTKKYGADAVRWYFYTVNQPWDDKMFKEKDIEDVSRRFIGILWNSFVYWKTYNINSKIKNQNAKLQFKIKNFKLTINKWLVIRFSQLVKETENLLDNYDIVSAARKIEEFAVEDISHWYIRRIREIMKEPQSHEAKETSAVFGCVLLELAKLLAPFTPFIAEKIYLEIGGKKQSAHLEDFPKSRKLQAANYKLIKGMEEARKIVSLALEARAKAGIKIRQPLASLKIQAPSSKSRFYRGFSEKPELQAPFSDLIKGEINVKKITFDKNIKNEIELNTKITPELKEEGLLREVIRSIQELRKKTGLIPKDRPKLLVKTNEKGEKFITRYSEQIKKETLLSKIELVNHFPQDAALNIVKQDEIEIRLILNTN